MKIINFPKNKNAEGIKKNKKFQVVKEIIEMLFEQDADFHIIINKRDAKNILINDNLRENVILTSNYDIGKRLNIDYSNSCVAEITGDELD